MDVEPRSKPISYRLYQGLWGSLDWLYPPHCAGCDAPGSLWCPRCRARSERLAEPLCTRCGLPLQQDPVGGDPRSFLCPLCRRDPPPLSALRSWGAYEGPLRSAILALKYHRGLSLGLPLGQLLLELLPGLPGHYDLLVPVPLAPQHRRERGYNQSTFLALPVALAMRIHLRSAALQRVHETSSQVGLRAPERRQNVQGAFRADPKLAAGHNVLLVDDVVTTGATLNACAAALLAAGANRVAALSVARAL
jgi:ComF family protein